MILWLDFGSGKRLVLLGNKPLHEPKLTQNYFRHIVSISYCELTSGFGLWLRFPQKNISLIVKDVYVIAQRLPSIINFCYIKYHGVLTSLIARFKGPMWGPPGVARTQVGPCWDVEFSNSHYTLHSFFQLLWLRVSLQEHIFYSLNRAWFRVESLSFDEFYQVPG